MIINMSDILSREGSCENMKVGIEFDSFDSKLGKYDIVDKSLVDLTLTNKGADKVLIEALANLSINIPCARCLENVKTDFNLSFSKEYDFGKEDEESESGYVIGYNLDVDKIVYSEILVNWPFKVLCSEDCKGICNCCGINLNQGACDCQRTQLDPRMAVIQDIFKEFKEV